MWKKNITDAGLYYFKRNEKDIVHIVGVINI